MTVFSTFAGRNLSAAHIDSPALEQLAIVLAAQRVSNVHTEYGYFGEGARNQDKGLTEGDIRWLHPVIRYLQAPTIREEFSIPIDLCRRMKMPSPTTEPNAYLAVAELNGFIQSVLATMREQLQRAGLSSHLTAPGLAVTPVIGVDTDTLSLIKNFINANKPPVQTKDSIREAVNHINDDIATEATEVTSGILIKYHDRASKLKAFLVDFQTQGQSGVTDYDMVNDIHLMANTGSMGRALRFQGITMETALQDGHLKCVYRGTADKILEKVELAFKNHSTDNLIPVTTLVSILPPLIASSETEELTATLRPFHFAIVDEADSILVDEARTPLIISGEGDGDAPNKCVRYFLDGRETERRYAAATLAASYLERNKDYEVDYKGRRVTLTDAGFARCGNQPLGLVHLRIRTSAASQLIRLILGRDESCRPTLDARRGIGVAMSRLEAH